MVIGGRIDVVGSQRGRVREAIDLLATRRQPGLPIAIEESVLRLGAGPADDATIWLFGVDREHEVWIQRGENRGRVIRYHNVVREVSILGRWSGEVVELALPLQRLAADGRDSAAVVVQRPGTRRDPGGSPDRAPRALDAASDPMGSPNLSSRWMA